MKIISFIVLFIAFAMPATAQWIKQEVETTASFRGLSVVTEKVIWASGTGGTVIRTTDGGNSWDVIKVPDAEKLDFRDIEAFDAKTAYILSIGNGEASRIYKTTDGGKTWKAQFVNKEQAAFYDAIACWNKKNCVAMSDPVDGKYRLVTTKDGESWSIMDTSAMPAAKDGEAAFAASGTCLYIDKSGAVFLVSGGSHARVFRSNDKGVTWTVAETPLAKGTPGSGIFSIAMRNSKNGVIVGGNYEKPTDTANNAALTNDGGRTWLPMAGLSGYRSGVAFIDGKIIVAVGTGGSDVSYDRGKTWRVLRTEDLNAVATDRNKTAWAVGPRGYVGRQYFGEIVLN